MEIVVSGGTSAAAPLFGAMINRINDERLLAGKKPIGFLNQILYQHPEVFTDVSRYLGIVLRRPYANIFADYRQQ